MREKSNKTEEEGEEEGGGGGRGKRKDGKMEKKERKKRRGRKPRIKKRKANATFGRHETMWRWPGESAGQEKSSISQSQREGN